MQALATAVWRLLGWIDLIVFTAVLWLLSGLPAAWTRRWYPALFRVWCRVFVRALGVTLHRHERYSGTLPRHYLLIANHPSAFEDIGIPALFPVDCLAKVQVRKWWFAGRIAERAGTLFVDRESRESRRQALADMEQALRDGRNIALYPEGGCLGRRLGPRFKFGAFELSVRTGLPIVPVFIHYEAQQAFEWQGQTLPRKIFEIATAPNRHAHYHVFDAMEPQDHADADAFRAAVYRRYLDWQARYLE
jgi:1-acyl-sn-glycerol-3-phosphate acyltransferase